MTSQALPRAQEPLYGVAPDDAETIIHELGMRLVDAYNEAHAKTVTAGSKQSPWGSKQREQLLRALITEVGRHARVCKNAALSTTEAGLAEFARKTFENGKTRSPRDRKPITQNVDKVIGGWLHQWSRWLRLDRLERVFQRDTLVDSYSGDVQLRERRATFRLTLTLAYPWRVTLNRRLRITAKLAELEPGGVARVLPFPSNANADAVAIPEERSPRPDEAQMLEGQLDHVIALARMFQQHRLADSLSATRRTFLKYDVLKITAALLLLVTMSVAASPVGRKFVARVVDAIRSSSSLREMIEKLRADPKEGVFVAPGGAQSQVAVSGSGSQLRIAPGPSPQRVHMDAILSAKDLADIAALIVPLADGNRTGIGATQFREAKGAPIMPWFVELAVIPEQDAELAAELAREAASVAITSKPPLPTPAGRHTENLALPGKRVSVVSEFYELPRTEQRYAITATVRRASGTVETYHAELRVDRSGFMTLVRDGGKPVTPVTQVVKVGHPICTSISNVQMGGFLFDQTDYVQASAPAFKEQEVLLTIYPPSANPHVRATTVDWGDGSRADFDENENSLFLAKHAYRVGERVYPIKIYFNASPVTYQFDLYVFSTRGPERDVATLDYETPYPPNPEEADLYASGWDEKDIAIVHRPGPVTTDSISFSRHYDPWVWRVSLGYETSERRKIRYFWRDGTILDIPNVTKFRQQ
jgi:hypothetical protein